MFARGQLGFGDDEPLASLGPKLMVQAPAAKAESLGELTATLGIGAVLSAEMSYTTKRAVRTLRRRNHSSSILLDRQRYLGQNRANSDSPPSQDWIDFQRGLHLPWALTDSGYIGSEDAEGLRSTLTYGHSFGPNVICALPLHGSWLRDRHNDLTNYINENRVPVALLLEAEKDPLADVATLQGLVDLLQGAEVPVALLRSDVAAVGALAVGAAASAIGATSDLRHIFPQVDRPDDQKSGFTSKVSALVPALLSYRTLEKIDTGIVAAPELSVWKCRCYVCKGRLLDWINDSGDPGRYAFEHSAAALSDMANQILRSGDPRNAWLELCDQAAASTRELNSTLAPANPWRVASNLKAWRSLILPE